MKFQIILETGDKKKAAMPDDEFEKLMRRSMKIPGFKLIGARSLEGIQARVWEPANAKLPEPGRRRMEKDPLE